MADARELAEVVLSYEESEDVAPRRFAAAAYALAYLVRDGVLPEIDRLRKRCLEGVSMDAALARVGDTPQGFSCTCSAALKPDRPMVVDKSRCPIHGGGDTPQETP